MTRMFAAVLPPEPVKEELAEFLQPRSEHPWIDPEQWHITLAFLARVNDARLDELLDGLRAAGRRRSPVTLRLHGAGAFPDPVQAKVLWLDIAASSADLDELHRLATNVRRAAAHSGAPPDGKDFRPHLTVSRLKRAGQQLDWLDVLSTYDGSPWQATDFALIESHLGEGPRGRPRYEIVERIPLLDDRVH
ncbi:RNA 2',3'-cyclic phosphodiesterase [Flexivirga meconopsidis]|uniref:RNA 2',3'-cyclic phosphodiesterase n=1 Tax=Flexivirga meconopsidis TaxID=2977121 RepID=UPI00223F7C8E|nr:RNA 2',3'-cyclic phosphodiesterase [Flexivirga meconopsidis]